MNDLGALETPGVTCLLMAAAFTLNCVLGLHCNAVHCTALHCTTRHCTALHCTALHCTALHCATLHNLRCTPLDVTALHIYHNRLNSYPIADQRFLVCQYVSLCVRLRGSHHIKNGCRTKGSSRMNHKLDNYHC